MFTLRYWCERYFNSRFWTKEGSDETPPEEQGLEFTLPVNRCHFTIPEEDEE